MARYRAAVERAATTLGRQVEISFTEAFVPSFMEVWVFAQVTLHDDR